MAFNPYPNNGIQRNGMVRGAGQPRRNPRFGEAEFDYDETLDQQQSPFPPYDPSGLKPRQAGQPQFRNILNQALLGVGAQPKTAPQVRPQTSGVARGTVSGVGLDKSSMVRPPSPLDISFTEGVLGGGGQRKTAPQIGTPRIGIANPLIGESGFLAPPSPESQSPLFRLSENAAGGGTAGGDNGREWRDSLQWTSGPGVLTGFEEGSDYGGDVKARTSMKNTFGKIAKRYPNSPDGLRMLVQDPDFRRAFPNAALVDHPTDPKIDFGGQLSDFEEGVPVGVVDVLKASGEGGWQWLDEANSGGDPGAVLLPQPGQWQTMGNPADRNRIFAALMNDPNLGGGNVTVDQLLAALMASEEQNDPLSFLR